MRFNPTVQSLSDDDVLTDASDNSVVKFTPSALVNDMYKSNHSVKYVMNGFEEYSIEGEYEKLRQGETMLVNGERKVSAQSSGAAIAIFLEDELINEISSVLLTDKQPQPGLLEMKDAERVSSRSFTGICNTLWNVKEVNLTEEFYYEMGAMYVTSFMETVKGRIPLKSRLAEIENVDRLQVAKSFIFDNINTKISLEKIAEESAMSKYHLLRNFKKLYGQTPLSLHRWLRINKAKALLKSNLHTATAVAHLMDYPDLATFSKQFKLETKVSPSYYLKDKS